MKKIFLLLSLYIISFRTQAQTITFTNSPVVGDVNNLRFCDSVGVIPKNTGAGSLWDFSSCTINSSSLSINYINASSHSAFSSFAGSNIAEIPNNGNYSVNFCKFSSTKYEWYGQYDQFMIKYDVYLTDPLIINAWPMSFGTSSTDMGSGTIKDFTTSVAASATAIVVGSGTGTINLPGGSVYNDILQTKLTQTITGSFSNKTVTIVRTTYSYYHSSQKFPLLSLTYESIIEALIPFGVAESWSRRIQVNNAAIASINEINFEENFDMYPNPANENFSIHLNNENNEKGSVEIYNELGQITKRVDLGNESIIKTNISVSDIKPGVYIVKTTVGDRTSSRKLIIQQ